MECLEIEGGRPLYGRVRISGAKNAALPILCASLLADSPLTLYNVPHLSDVTTTLELLGHMGVDAELDESQRLTLDARRISCLQAPYELVSKMRASILVLGPLLARFGEAKVALPGGCAIGQRPVDLHMKGLAALGAEVDIVHGDIVARAKRLRGARVVMDLVTVTGTENIMMAATLAEGETIIENAAREPEVVDLAHCLQAMGAKIEGIASNRLTITGVSVLHGCRHRLLPDMIEIGSFIGMAAMTGSEITIKNSSAENLGIIPESFRRMGIEIVQQNDDLFIPQQDHYTIESFMDGSILTIADAPWPGLTPDLLSVMLVVATKAEGCVLIHQKMFESRLFFVDKLIDMGAQIILCDPHRATVIGHDRNMKLRPTVMTSPDIRAGVALLIAALSAEGKSLIHNIEQIDRGYEEYRWSP